MYKTSLVWLRRDLRSLDNPALSKACEISDTVYALYLAAPDTWRQHHMAPIQSDLIRRQLDALRDEFNALNIELLVLNAHDFTGQVETLRHVIQVTSAEAVFANRELEVRESARDNEAQSRIGVPFHLSDDRCVIQPGTLKNGGGQPYKVFTPFSKTWVTELMRLGWDCEPRPHPKVLKPIVPVSLEILTEWPYDTGNSSAWDVGSESVLKALRSFSRERAQLYKKHRDLPAIDGTSKLSAYLAIGALSGRQCVARLVADHGAPDTLNEGARTWLNELIWRDFYQHVMVAWPHVVKGKAFKTNYEAISWHNDPMLFDAWCKGQTGFPIVDAAMRQLNQTGWMHNRLRMIVASFLCKDLLIDWRWGEQYFMSRLIDGDFAANNGGWQWAASTGTDAAPYFRIFNPVTQSQRFDPQGVFIRSYVKELASTDDKRVHLASDGQFYNRAVVDHSEQRKLALATYKTALEAEV
ncbi:deoxyribodipyrimidine photo-lyase [Echinimonas agarilytica]|uniref:Deoxyribodipyrimidine photo-lyase n=1 Tax=Echinimonas agarilytica TaxID=1215918 RepID=A0AA41W7J9_9GAMM|nr:deoxyribodipyrimidine photo-lyase [Echinimonas agarilytica]MCM2679993.1 deoxyribodipyrimidine photo-lyase [Echinimonas agarilytica]